MEKRRYPRIAMKSLCVDVSDGVGFFSGIISDFSRVGFCMTDMSKKLNWEVKIMTVVISGQGKSFKMNVKPKWSTKDNLTKTVGAEILDTLWDWTEFVMNFEPAPHKDVWERVHF